MLNIDKIKRCSSDAQLLIVPHTHTHTHTELARRTFAVAAPSICNSLPADIRPCENILTFKRHLKTHLFKLTESSCTASSASVSLELKALYKSAVIIIIN